MSAEISISPLQNQFIYLFFKNQQK